MPNHCSLHIASLLKYSQSTAIVNINSPAPEFLMQSPSTINYLTIQEPIGTPLESIHAYYKFKHNKNFPHSYIKHQDQEKYNPNFSYYLLFTEPVTCQGCGLYSNPGSDQTTICTQTLTNASHTLVLNEEIINEINDQHSTKQKNFHHPKPQSAHRQTTTTKH